MVHNEPRLRVVPIPDAAAPVIAEVKTRLRRLNALIDPADAATERDELARERDADLQEPPARNQLIAAHALAHDVPLITPRTNERRAMTAPALPEYTIEALEAEPALRVDAFTNEDAFELGTIAANVIRERALNLAVDIRIGDELVYRARFGSTGPGNDPWLTGKAAAVLRHRVPSLLVRLQTEARGEQPDTSGDDDGIRVAGGSIPIFRGDDVIGTLTLSGEPDVVDHQTAAEAVARYRTALGRTTPA